MSPDSAYSASRKMVFAVGLGRMWMVSVIRGFGCLRAGKVREVSRTA